MSHVKPFWQEESEVAGEAEAGAGEDASSQMTTIRRLKLCSHARVNMLPVSDEKNISMVGWSKKKIILK